MYHLYMQMYNLEKERKKNNGGHQNNYLLGGQNLSPTPQILSIVQECFLAFLLFHFTSLKYFSIKMLKRENKSTEK